MPAAGRRKVLRFGVAGDGSVDSCVAGDTGSPRGSRASERGDVVEVRAGRVDFCDKGVARHVTGAATKRRLVGTGGRREIRIPRRAGDVSSAGRVDGNGVACVV